MRIILFGLCAVLLASACQAGGIIGIGGGGTVVAASEEDKTAELYIVAGWLLGESDRYGFGGRVTTNSDQEVTEGAGWVAMRIAGQEGSTAREYLRLEVGRRRGVWTVSPTLGTAISMFGSDRISTNVEVAINVNGEATNATVVAGLTYRAF